MAFTVENSTYTAAECAVLNGIVADLVARGVDESNANDLVHNEITAAVDEVAIRSALTRWLA